ncbi:MAG: hypothetical protein JO230_05560 [Xanthobacteraceae bacterium]|nr:hypothetical protein [Xanthobacteraceae bacterium]
MPRSREKVSEETKRVAPRIVQGIGIVSSIPYNGTNLQTKFIEGLNMPLLTPQYQDKLGYNSKKLADAVQDFDSDATVGLIVTFGGIVAWIAAMLNASKTPFISLIGGMPGNFPPPPSGTFVGCVNLQSFAQDQNRITHLGTKGFAPAQICLLYNPNSSMAAAETTNWGGAPPVSADNGVSDPTKFAADFSNIAEPAVVISADPYFQHHRNELIKAANASNKYITYPLQVYANNSGTQPTRGKTTLQGPDLDASYKLVGQMASTFLAGQPINPATVMAPQIINDLTAAVKRK